MTNLPSPERADAVPTPGGDGEVLVALSGIGHRFGRRQVLEGVDLSVRRGELVTLIGPNGAGKSTLVRMVLGLLRPAAGSVSLSPGLEIGYVPQKIAIDPVLPLNVRRFLDLPRRHPDTEVEAALAEVGAEAIAGQPMQALSGGELQRLLLARALLRLPDLLVLDEPLQNVDFSGQVELSRLIERVRAERGCGILMVSHDLHLVMAGTNRVVCLNRHVCCSGAPEAVSRHPAYLALFGHKAAESFAVYTHAHDHDHDLTGKVVELAERDATTRDRDA